MWIVVEFMVFQTFCSCRTLVVRSARVFCTMCLCRNREKERETMKVERAAMRAAEEKKMGQTLPNPDPYTQFDTLHVPTVDVSISTDKMFEMMKNAPSNRRVIIILHYVALSSL